MPSIPNVDEDRTFTITVDEEDFLRLTALVGMTTGCLSELYEEMYNMCEKIGVPANSYRCDTGYDEFGSNVPVTMEKR